MDSITNIYILLKNLKRFVNHVPINPKSPKYKAWEEDRAEMGKAIYETERILKKPGYLEGLNVFIGPLKDCGKVPSKQVLAQSVAKYGRDLQKVVMQKNKIYSRLKLAGKKG